MTKLINGACLSEAASNKLIRYESSNIQADQKFWLSNTLDTPFWY